MQQGEETIEEPIVLVDGETENAMPSRPEAFTSLQPIDPQKDTNELGNDKPNDQNIQNRIQIFYPKHFVLFF